MSKTLRNTLIAIAIILGTVLILKSLSMAINESLSSGSKSLQEEFGPTCELKWNWEVEKYVVKEWECIGLVGPHYSTFNLLENDQFIDRAVYKVDYCSVHFHKGDSLEIRVNLCTETVTEIMIPKAEKDSIQIQMD